jgi:hypothetical protein
MAVQMNRIECPKQDECKFASGCMVVKAVKDGATFSPVLRLRLENLEWRVKCFSFVSKYDRR